MNWRVNQIPMQIARVVREWSSKTLEDLRSDAVLEDTGIAFDAVREQDGMRICLVICVTGEDQLRRFREAGLVDNGADIDWAAFTTGAAVTLAALSGTICVKALKSSGDSWMALVMAAAVPDSIRRLEDFFDLGR